MVGCGAARLTRPTNSRGVHRPHPLRDLPALLLFHHCDVILALKVEPELLDSCVTRFLRPTGSHLAGKRYAAEIAAEPHRGVGGDRAPEAGRSGTSESAARRRKTAGRRAERRHAVRKGRVQTDWPAPPGAPSPSLSSSEGPVSKTRAPARRENDGACPNDENRILDSVERSLAPAPTGPLTPAEAAVFAAPWRWANDQFAFWKLCANRRCRRARCCRGEPRACLDRHLPQVPQQARDRVHTMLRAARTRARASAVSPK